ncbi:putative galactose-proton symport [Lepidopterella palustris CBS 459.81]|uniref:Putative galactose-proton symport n=1 Tax=Lepidopterella palustris CBS 459.81 TaxID=1314670 RepID=A0A8E2JFE5_9PEZI|nr:putative galactose-proton symport [Lepidopterella palustris CBS 459.81]
MSIYATAGNTAPRNRFRTLLKNNELGIVDNPLLHREPEDQDNDVRTTYANHADLHDFLDVNLLIRGARLARDPELFEASGDLSNIERSALQREKTSGFWQQPKALRVIILTCCIGAIVQGWVQSSIAGANLQWPSEFHLNVDINNPYTHDVWIFGAVNAITYFSASAVGAWLSDPLNEYVYGRRGAVFVAALFTFGFTIGSAYTRSWRSLFACRFGVGIGMGAKASVVPIWESEVAPARIRGRLLLTWQTFTALGIFLGNAANLVVYNRWRLQIVSPVIPAVVLLVLVLVCYESPRWLIKRNKYREAYESLLQLRETPLQSARDLYYIHSQLQVETSLFAKRRNLDDDIGLGGSIDDDTYQAEVGSTSYWTRVMQLFNISRNLRASLAAFIVMISQQLSGVNIFAFLAATLFNDANIAPKKSLWLAFGFGIANFIFSPLAYWFIDSRGRRFLLLLSLFSMIWALIATGFSFQIPKDSSARVPVITFFMIIYTLCYSPGAGVVPFTYSSEVYPLVNREAGMSFAVFWNLLGAGILALIVPQLVHSLGHTGLLGLFAGFDALAFILVWLLVPGTVQVATLEEMNYIFGVPTRRHVEYQIKEVLPWFISRILLRPTPPLKPLYRWNRAREEQRQVQNN